MVLSIKFLEHPIVSQNFKWRSTLERIKKFEQLLNKTNPCILQLIEILTEELAKFYILVSEIKLSNQDKEGAFQTVEMAKQYMRRYEECLQKGM